MLLKGLYMATKSFKTFIKEPWNVVDIVIILMSFACIGIYVHRSYLVGDFLSQVEMSRHNKFVNYFNLIYMEELFTIIAALLICVATIRLWKLLRFGVIFKIMERTLILSLPLLAAVTICHTIIVLMFAYSGLILFGSNSYDFRDTTATFTSLMLLSLNLYQQFNFEYIQEAHGGLGYAYYTFYMLITLTITTLYIAVIVISYEESCNYYSELRPYYTVQKYIQDECTYIKELIRRNWKFMRLAGGEDNNAEDEHFEKKVTPKSDEHRYADSIIVPIRKMFAMSLIARCVIYNRNKRKEMMSEKSEYEIELMKKIVLQFYGKPSISKRNLISFVIYEQKNKIKFVSNCRILQMEGIVNYILNKGTLKNSRVEVFDEMNQSVLPPRTNGEQLEYFEEILKSILRVINNITITNLKTN